MKRLILAVWTIALVLGGTTSVCTAAEPSFFVLIYTQGPAWKAGEPMEHQDLRAHFGYMMSLRNAHKLFVAGPLDSNGGLILLRAKDLDEANDIMAHDPSIIAGIFKGAVHTWRDAVDSGDTAAGFLAQPE